MADNSPGATVRKRRLIAPLVIAVIVAGLLIVAAMGLFGRTPKPPPAEPQPSPPAEAVTPVTPLTPPVLTRADLIERARAAAAAYASGDPVAEGADSLVRRTFRIRLPFGCAGPRPGPGAAPAYFEQDAERGTVKLTARSVDLTTLPMIRSMPQADSIEKAEGFWIPRPWSLTETCPPNREATAVAQPAAPAGQSLGLVRLSDAGSSRVPRRDGRPYEFVQKDPTNALAAGARGYRLMIEGQIATFPDGRSIRCWSETPDHQPICLYAVTFERIAFEDASGAVMAEWRE
jgi:hypothetical protein